MRALRNVAIIALLAVPIAFLPGGGQAASAVVTALTLAFLATLGAAGHQLYRANRLTVDTLPDGQRALLFAAVGTLALMVAAADELLATGPGTLAWIALIALSVFAIVRVWTVAHRY